MVSKAGQVLGGELEGFSYAVGSTDVYAIVELPDDVSAAAAAMAVGLSGAGSVETVVLSEPEGVDALAKIATSYRRPGG